MILFSPGCEGKKKSTPIATIDAEVSTRKRAEKKIGIKTRELEGGEKKQGHVAQTANGYFVQLESNVSREIPISPAAIKSSSTPESRSTFSENNLQLEHAAWMSNETGVDLDLSEKVNSEINPRENPAGM